MLALLKDKTKEKLDTAILGLALVTLTSAIVITIFEHLN